MSSTILQLLEARFAEQPAGPAILSEGRSPLSYLDLIQQIRSTVRQLRHAGIERNDPVALVLPDGPEMAVAFLSVASTGTCAPLNPAYRTEEFQFYMSDLDAKALVIPQGLETPARWVAQQRGIPVFELFS